MYYNPTVLYDIQTKLRSQKLFFLALSGPEHSIGQISHSLKVKCEYCLYIRLTINLLETFKSNSSLKYMKTKFKQRIGHRGVNL